MTLGVLLALGASLCWALANVAIQRAGRAVGPFRALLWAQLTSGAGIAVLSAIFDDRTAPLSAEILGWVVVGGAAALLAYVCLFAAFAHGRLSVTVPIMSSWSAISAGIGIGVFGERLRGQQIAGAVTVIAGVILVARASVAPDKGPAAAAGDPPSPRADRTALFASLGAAVGFGVLIPAIDRIAPAAGRLGAVPLVYAIDIALGLPLALALRQPLGPPPAAAWGKVLAAGLFETVGFGALSLAEVRAPVAVVSPAASLSAAMTVLYAWVVLRERPGRAAAIGAVLASAGVVALSLR